jgi:anthranilate phosphoribosyltransferase
MVVHNRCHVDELTTADINDICFASNGQIDTLTIDPAEFGFKKCRVEELRGGSADENAGILVDILRGEDGAKRDTVILNAAAALMVAQKTESIKDGIFWAKEAIDSGKAEQKLESFIKFTNGMNNA